MSISAFCRLGRVAVLIGRVRPRGSTLARTAPIPHDPKPGIISRRWSPRMRTHRGRRTGTNRRPRKRAIQRGVPRQEKRFAARLRRRLATVRLRRWLRLGRGIGPSFQQSADDPPRVNADCPGNGHEFRDIQVTPPLLVLGDERLLPPKSSRHLSLLKVLLPPRSA